MPISRTSVLFLFCCFFSTLQGQNFSLNFDGDDDLVLFPDCEAMTYPNFTIEGWFKCKHSENPQVIIMSFLDIPEKNANITLEVRETGLLRFNYRPVAVVLGGENLFSTTVVSDNVWHHFAAVKGAATPKGGDGHLRLYIDGVLEAHANGPFDDINIVPIFEMGRNRFEPQINYRSFKGNIDDFKIWHRAKFGFEILNTYKSESAGSESGLYSNYKFDINLNPVYDCSPYENHGVRKGFGGTNNLPQYALDIPILLDKLCEPQSVGVEDGLHQSTADNLALISPNPVVDHLLVELTEMQQIYGQIYASDGTLVRTITLADKVNTIGVSALPAGAYWIILSNAKTSQTQRFIKI
ncbi:MAG: LamG-like jellyroll fold domain-containing protein [Saprospiraceae bacterium]